MLLSPSIALGGIRIRSTSVLADEAATKTGDLYIRSVCFSPDGKFLATGAEDKQIRVRGLGYSHQFAYILLIPVCLRFFDEN